MDARKPTGPCSTCGCLIGPTPDGPPNFFLDPALEVDPPIVRGIISESEQRIADLKEINSRILDTQKKVLQRLEEYDSFVLYQKSLIAPIRRIPPEVLSTIFVACVAGPDPEQPSDASELPWVLGKICHLWRRIVLSSPHLWNCISVLTDDSGYGTDPSLVRTSFKLARELPLSIDLNIEYCPGNRALMNTLVDYSHRIGELEVTCSCPLSFLSGMSSRLINLHSLKLTHTSYRDSAILTFSNSPQLRDVCFLPSYRLHHSLFPLLNVPWSQLTTVTIKEADLGYVWKVFSHALRMEKCTFIQTLKSISCDSVHWQIIQHTGLKELSFTDIAFIDTNFPASFFNTLVLPNLISLSIKRVYNSLDIDLLVSLVIRSGCSLVKLVLTSIIEGSLISLLEVTTSLTHLEVQILSPADIKGLTIDKKSGKKPITPFLHVIRVRMHPHGITDPSSINTLICSRVDLNNSDVEPIQNIHLHFKNRSGINLLYCRLVGLPWTPSPWFKNDCTMEWMQSLRELVAEWAPKNQVLLYLFDVFCLTRRCLAEHFCLKRPP